MRAKPGNYELVAAQFLRALRGSRSQRALARRLGYKANPITDWEHGRRFPTAEETLRAAQLLGVDVRTQFAHFHRASPPTVRAHRLELSAWLNEVRGGSSLPAVAERANVSRFAVGRWFRAQAKPRLPDFFRVVDAMTDRLPDLVALLVPIEKVPLLLPRYRAAQAARRTAYDAPWSEAVLLVLTSNAYAALTTHQPGYIARLLGISEREEKLSLDLLVRAGVIQRNRGRFRVKRANAVDTRGDREGVSALLQHWNRVAHDKVKERRPEYDYLAYNVCALSREDYLRVRALLARTFREVRSMVAASSPNERVALVNLQLFDLMLEPGPGSANKPA